MFPEETDDAEGRGEEIDDEGFDEEDDDDSDDGEPSEIDDEPAQPETRAEKRRKRASNYRELQEDYDDLAEQFEEAQRQNAAFQQQMAAWQAQQAAMQQHLIQGQQRQQPTGPDPDERELNARYEEMRSLQERVNPRWAELSPEAQTQATQDQRRINNEIQRLNTKIAMRQFAPQGPPQQQVHPVVAALQVEYPDVFQNERAHKWAMAREAQFIAEGRQMMDAAKTALNEARNKYSTSPGGKPTQRRSAGLRATLSGQGRGGSSGAADDQASNDDWDESQQKMAERVTKLTGRAAKRAFLKAEKRVKKNTGT